MKTINIWFPVFITAMVFFSLLLAFVVADENVMGSLNQLDQRILIWTNNVHVGISHTLLSKMANFSFWIPLYGVLTLCMLAWERVRFGRIYFFIGMYLLVQLLLVFAFNWEFSHLRPFYERSISSLLEVESVGRAQKFGCLPLSSSASGLALFICLYFKRNFWPLKLAVSLWAILLLYISLYNGWNYPHEILISAFISLLAGFIAHKAYLYYSKNGRLI